MLSRSRAFAWVSLVGALSVGCGDATSPRGASTLSAASPAARATTIEQLIPAERLQQIKAAMPRVEFPALQRALESEETLWYDEQVMAKSYQDSLGAQSNTTWPNLVAAPESIISGLHDRAHKRWQFPFATTAGTDDSPDVRTANFIRLPHVGGRPLSIPIWEVRRNYDRPQWMWVYPNDTMIGEVIFVTDGPSILTVEIRTRTRHPSGWATNVFRPFPRAVDLAAAIKRERPTWQTQATLQRLVAHLENPATLTPKTLAARAALAPTFQQAGALDVLPEVGDPELVRALLRTTVFRSAFGAVWKEHAGQKAFAASSSSGLSIVPRNYTTGVIEVNDDSCARCHREAGRLVSDFYFDLYLYGELWGKDGIFSFHPFDESRYPQLRTGVDNRSINPRLKQMGVFERYDAAKHRPPLYPERAPPP